MSSQGSHAAINGNNFEKIIRKELKEIFDLSGNENITEHQMLKKPDVNDMIIVKSPEFDNIWNRSGKGNFDVGVYNKGEVKVIGECKWMSVSGSISHKIPYVIQMMEENIKTHHQFLVFGGEKWDKDYPLMIDDLKKRVKNINEKTGKNIKVLRYNKEWEDYKIFLKNILTGTNNWNI